MKNRIFLNPLKFAAAWLVVLFAVSGILAQAAEPWSINRSPLPAPTGFVNDYAGVIDAATKQQLETKLGELRKTTDPSVELSVAVVRTTGDRDISEYSIAVARGWGIGSKEDDNPSALLFVAIDDRKYFTQVSKDLEDELPDGIVGSLQRQYLVPEFRKGNYGKGIADTIDAYIARIRDKGNVAGNSSNTSGDRRTGEQAGISGGVLGLFCCAGIIILILIIIFSNSRGGPTKRDRDRWGGGGFGGSGSGGMGGSALPWIVGGILGGGSGGSSGGSDWGGSSGGSDWGGFGGGGDFGGGGAGGDW